MRIEHRKELKSNINDVQNFAKEFQSEYNVYRDSLLYTKTCTQNCSTEEDGMVEVYKNLILEEGRPQTQSDKPPPKSASDSYKKQMKHSAYTPRLISVRSYQELFELALTNSWLRYR